MLAHSIQETAVLPKPPRDPHQKAAYCDGWKAAGLNAKRHERPSYPTNTDEREAFTQGWDVRAERIANGYYDNTDCKQLFSDALEQRK